MGRTGKSEGAANMGTQLSECLAGGPPTGLGFSEVGFGDSPPLQFSSSTLDKHTVHLFFEIQESFA